MSSPEPIPGRCGARTRGDEPGYCARFPESGRTRCRLHGGATPRVHVRASPETKARLAELLADPDLLEARAAVALSQLGVERLALDPEDFEIELYAHQVRRKLHLPEEDAEGNPLPLSEIELARARVVLVGERTQALIEASHMHGKTVSTAAKQERTADLLVRATVPVFTRFSERVVGIVRRFLSPTQQAAFLQELRKAMDDSTAEVFQLGMDADAKRTD